jgi:NAD(P)-dependent dehydrogenase (short-subunit alcohol dehydrogenase family)
MGALAGRLALVTGASRGIGAAAAAVLAEEGATVIRVSRGPADTGGAPGVVDVRADLATDEGLALAIRQTLALGVPDLIVSSAGGFSLGDLGDDTVESLDRLYRVNLRAPIAVAGALLPRMRERGHGRHVLIGSIADHQAFPGNAAYAATKFGLRGFHEVLRAEYRGSGVLCSLVSPGPVDTAMWDPIDPDNRPGFPPRSSMLRPGDVAAAVRWIAIQPGRVDVAVLQLYPA